MKNRNTKKIPRAAEEAQRRGAAGAAGTRGRARTFTDRKKRASRNACRGQS